MTAPRLTVIVTFYDEIAYLETALASVAAQGIEGVEILVVNDNPEAFGPDWFATQRLPEGTRVIHHARNAGLSAARNTALAEARGERIAFLDADDYYLPGGLVRHLEHAEATGADITHAQTVISRPARLCAGVQANDIRHHTETRMAKGPERLDLGFHRIHSWASIYRRAFLEEHGVRFDPEQTRFEDRLFVVSSMIAADSLAVLAEPVRVWRRREGSITTSRKPLGHAGLKLAMFEKVVALWEGSGVAEARSYGNRELVLHAMNIVFADDISAWADPRHADQSEGTEALRARLRALCASQPMRREDVVRAFDPRHLRFHATHTGGGRITPADLHGFMAALAEGRFEAAFEIVDRANAPLRRATPSPSSRLPEGCQVFVHFGLHKTGTTFIQRQLDANRAALRARGILFPATGLGFPPGNEPVRPDGLPGHQALLWARKQGRPDLIEAFHREIHEAGCDRVIISVENLAHYRQGEPGLNLATMERALDGIGIRDRVIPVVFFRRPDAWFEAHYRELVGNGHGLGYQTPEEYLLNMGTRLDFAAIVAGLEELTGQTARIGDFDAAIRGPGLLHSFLDACGMGDAADAVTLDEGLSHYPAACNAQIATARLVSSIYGDDDQRKRVLRQFFRLVNPTDQRTPLFDPRQRRAALDLFETSSATMLRERGFAPDFATWRAEIDAAPPPVPPVIPPFYLETLARIGQWEQAIPPQPGPTGAAVGGGGEPDARAGRRILRRVRGLLGRIRRGR